MILPTVRDPRLVTIRRGGSLTDEDHHRLALWAAECTMARTVSSRIPVRDVRADMFSIQPRVSGWAWRRPSSHSASRMCASSQT